VNGADQLPDPIIAILSLPMIDDDVNFRIPSESAGLRDWFVNERVVARKRVEESLRDVMADYCLCIC
jgi:hypothetical protein